MSNQKFETIKRPVHLEGKKIQRINNCGHYAHMWLSFEPLAQGKGIEFIHTINEEKLPSNFIKAIEAGVRRALQRDGQEGQPVTDLRCSIDGSFHPSDSQETDYDQIAFQTTVEALRKVGTKSVG
jgi:elongation factor G